MIPNLTSIKFNIVSYSRRIACIKCLKSQELDQFLPFTNSYWGTWDVGVWKSSSVIQNFLHKPIYENVSRQSLLFVYFDDWKCVQAPNDRFLLSIYSFFSNENFSLKDLKFIGNISSMNRICLLKPIWQCRKWNALKLA